MLKHSVRTAQVVFIRSLAGFLWTFALLEASPFVSPEPLKFDFVGNPKGGSILPYMHGRDGNGWSGWQRNYHPIQEESKIVEVVNR
jgi:hypothetical protein